MVKQCETPITSDTKNIHAAKLIAKITKTDLTGAIFS